MYPYLACMCHWGKKIASCFQFTAFYFFLSFQDYIKDGLRFPNFNFNVSHHGDYVGIASEPICLVGLDIVSYAVPQKETIGEFIQNFSSYFSSLEWGNIVNAGTSDAVLVEFYRCGYSWNSFLFFFPFLTLHFFLVYLS